MLAKASTNIRAMGSLVIAVVTYIRALFVTRHRLALEAAALRQQLAVFKRKQPRLRLSRLDRLFWRTLRRVYAGWTDALITVKPETVVSWHRAGFRLFWRWRSRQPGRPRVTTEIRELIHRRKAENPGWGAPRIHGELLQLGFEISEPTVSRYLRRFRRRYEAGKVKRWLAFLNNHREVIVAFDFFYGSHAELFELSTLSLSLNTADDEFCTSIAPNIRPQTGLSSSCARLWRCPALIVTYCLVATQSSALRFSRS
jgi:hypothetical protein